MIRVLIVDDSKVIQSFLYNLLSSDLEIQVVGFASNGIEAIELVKYNKPDVITMDIHMPGIDGYEATRKIMETIPTPIVIVSGSLSVNEEAGIFKSLEAGALAVVHRPPGFGDPKYADARAELIQTVKQMSSVKTARLLSRNTMVLKEPTRYEQQYGHDLRGIRVIAIGASTGGPIAIQKILSILPNDFPVPVMIVQQIAMGFGRALLTWLNLTSGIKLKLAEDGETLLAGFGYLAPDHCHLGISQSGKIALNSDQNDHEFKPSINFLFSSVAKVYGSQAIGVLLTGIGKDGAIELKSMKDSGALTIVQDNESSLVFSMPEEALRIGASSYSLPPEHIAEILARSGTKKQEDRE
jgi:two-component system chemotaxis response regulator CheB